MFNLDLYSVNVDDKVREDIDKYKEIGTAKKQLYSMPQYFRDRYPPHAGESAHRDRGAQDYADRLLLGCDGS